MSAPMEGAWWEIEADDNAPYSCYPLKTDIVHHDKMSNVVLELCSVSMA